MQLNPIVYHLAVDGAIKKPTGQMEDSHPQEPSMPGRALTCRSGFEFLVGVRRERLDLNSLHQPY
jgi:hypothetical protein